MLSRSRNTALVLVLFLAGVALSGLVVALGLAESGKVPGVVGPAPTPTVDLAQARARFDAGGELTYQEVMAVRKSTVGDYPDPAAYDITSDAYTQAEMDHWNRERAFAAALSRCRLKSTVGWVAWWYQERGSDQKIIPDKYRAAVYLENPYDGQGKELRDGPEMFLAYLTNQQVSRLRYGERIRFSGSLMLLDGVESVLSPRYLLLDDDPPVPPATDAELSDLRLTLRRTMCFGTCPEYTLSVGPDGKVTFDGRAYTSIGAATATADSATLASLAYEVKKADFFSLDASYSIDVTDNPTYFLEVQMGGRSKMVSSYATRPRRLELLMDRIDQILNSAQWIRPAPTPSH